MQEHNIRAHSRGIRIMLVSGRTYMQAYHAIYSVNL